MSNERRITIDTKNAVTVATVNQKIQCGKVSIFSAEGRVIFDGITADLTADVSTWSNEDLRDLGGVLSAYADAREVHGIAKGTKK